MGLPICANESGGTEASERRTEDYALIYTATQPRISEDMRRNPQIEVEIASGHVLTPESTLNHAKREIIEYGLPVRFIGEVAAGSKVRF